MRAVGFTKTGSIENIQILDLPSPSKTLGPGEIRLKFLAGALNHLDLWVAKGLPRVTYSFPHIAGADLCAEVVESSSTKFAHGDHVVLYPAESRGLDSHGKPCPENLCGDFHIRGENTTGVFREEIVVHERFVFKKPKHLNIDEAAALPLTYLTAWQMLKEKAFDNHEPSQSVLNSPILVHGAGSGVTQALVNLLTSFGFSKIAVTSRTKEKLKAYAKVSGFVSDTHLEQSLKDWLQGEKFLWIFDHIGEVFFEMNIRLMQNGGKFITCGATSGFSAKLDLRHLYFRQLHILGSTMGSLSHFQEMLSWVDAKALHPLIDDKKFSFDTAQAAYQYLETQEQIGKIIIHAYQ